MPVKARTGRLSWSIEPADDGADDEADDQAAGDDRPVSIDDIGRDQVLAAIRDLYRQDPAPCDGKQLLILLREYFGFGALGDRIRRAMQGDIKAAVRRGILERPRNDGRYHLLTRTIGDYEPAFLRDLFLASLSDRRNPRTWIAQPEAIRDAARYLGFKNTGKTIQQLFKNAIRALLRAGDLERDGDTIRRI